MLNEESVSRRLRIMAGWVRNMREGTYEPNARTAHNIEVMLGECAVEVETMEFEQGKADLPARLRAAGNNVVAMKAILDKARLRQGGSL